jgi:co-chaperonin GroES (HSP10)
MTIRAIGNKIIVKTVIKETTRNGIEVPDSILPEGHIKATVVTTGEGTVLEGGSVHPCAVKAGDSIWFDKRMGIEITHDNEKYYVITENEILFFEAA